MSKQSVTIRDHFSESINLTIAEPQPEYGLVQLNARRDASDELISCDIKKTELVEALEWLLNVTITPNEEESN